MKQIKITTAYTKYARHNCIYFFFIFFFIHTIYSMDSSRLDDEHKLIARYAQRLAQEARTMVRFFINSKILTFNVCCLLFYTTIWIYV